MKIKAIQFWIKGITVIIQIWKIHAVILRITELIAKVLVLRKKDSESETEGL